MRVLLSTLLTCLQLGVAAQPSRDTISIIGVGDIMLGSAFPAGNLPPHDGRFLLKPVEKYLLQADFTFGNYEGTLFNGGGAPKRCADSNRCYVFKTPEHYAWYLQKAGFDAMSVANNHSGDFGPAGRESTIQALQRAGIGASGLLSHPYTILRRNGVCFGLAAFAPNAGTQNINNYAAAKKLVAYLDSVCDIVIVSFHGGAEGQARQHVPRKNEVFLGEDRGDVYRFSRTVIDAGADVVFGHGPHVPRAVDLYKGRFIIYSLGNFATYGRFSLKGAAGIAPLLKVFVNSKGRFLKGEIIPVKQSGAGGPQLDSESAAIRKLQQLTAIDSPASGLQIKANGAIVRIQKKKPKKAVRYA